ncbi:LysM peptidoglycan-binding domain-containing protein [Simkania negevensis]|uniref:LysM peptidoglycan-binding domain-containing protein n=1 Tax=Simkania negevensis TaxID=83561 RepID=A0ABS3AVG0_9BACT|nr:LysM peptidoglycan-binding domain-containing protein [Simkania negevensis]
MRGVYSCCLLLAALTFLSTSCQQKKGYPNYAQRQYLEQQVKGEQPFAPVALNEQGEEDLLLDIPLTLDSDFWKRKPYESIDHWRYRLQTVLVRDKNEIEIGKDRLINLENHQRHLIDEIEATLALNEKLSKELAHYTDKREKAVEEEESVWERHLPPFTIHLVEKGDTLCSIAREYYNQSCSPDGILPTAVDQIMLWNQGWLRNPDEITAGVGLVLFFDPRHPQSNEEVANHIEYVKSQNDKKVH